MHTHDTSSSVRAAAKMAAKNNIHKTLHGGKICPSCPFGLLERNEDEL
ncbi:MAG: hypothetical protein H7321_04045 [Bacteroidia bacterium]|nr:hypothetical protein [Bacteroidia bacterium]